MLNTSVFTCSGEDYDLEVTKTYFSGMLCWDSNQGFGKCYTTAGTLALTSDNNVKGALILRTFVKMITPP